MNWVFVAFVHLTWSGNPARFCLVCISIRELPTIDEVGGVCHGRLVVTQGSPTFGIPVSSYAWIRQEKQKKNLEIEDAKLTPAMPRPNEAGTSLPSQSCHPRFEKKVREREMVQLT